MFKHIKEWLFLKVWKREQTLLLYDLPEDDGVTMNVVSHRFLKREDLEKITEAEMPGVTEALRNIRKPCLHRFYSKKVTCRDCEND